MSVAEGGVGDKKIGGRVRLLEFAVENDSRDRVVGKLFADKVRLGYVDEFMFHVKVLDFDLNRINQHMSSDIQGHL